MEFAVRALGQFGFNRDWCFGFAGEWPNRDKILLRHLRHPRGKIFKACAAVGNAAEPPRGGHRNARKQLRRNGKFGFAGAGVAFRRRQHGFGQSAGLSVPAAGLLCGQLSGGAGRGYCAQRAAKRPAKRRGIYAAHPLRSGCRGSSARAGRAVGVLLQYAANRECPGHSRERHCRVCAA